MPATRIATILALVISAAALTVWIGFRVSEQLSLPTAAGGAVIPALLIGYLILRRLLGIDRGTE